MPVVSKTLAEADFPSGHVCVADPITFGWAEQFPALSLPISPGSYPVEVAVATFGTDERIAAARIVLRGTRLATRWRPAVLERGPHAGEIAGCVVDSGTVAFIDSTARKPQREDFFLDWIDSGQRTYRPTWSWFCAVDVGHRLVGFSSGWGDGLYASYWGFDREGDVVELVADFAVCD